MSKFKKNTNLDKKLFFWGVVETDVSLGGLLKKKSGSGRKWDERYIVISRNYIIYYKSSNGDGTPKAIDAPRGIINLSNVLNTDVQIAYDQDAKGLIFQVPTTIGRIYFFRCKDDRTIDKWIKLIKERSTALSGIRVEELGNVPQSISTIQAMFPRNISFPEKVAADQIERYIEQTKKYQTSLQQWEPFMRKVSLFLEYYSGPNRSYIDWFLSSDGPRVYLQKSEEAVVANWISYIERTVKEASFAGKTRFFREDLEETAQTCEAAISMIDGVNKYRKEFLKDAVFVENHTKEKEIFRKLADGYRALPSERSIDFRTYKGGSITGGKTEWTFGIQQGYPTLKGDCEGITMQFTAQGPELQSPIHGAVIWNGKTWVWYHPRTVFSIRYDWESKSGMFHQKTHQLEDTPMRKVDYPDWALQGAALKCQAKAGDSVPPVKTWEVSGSVPVPAALLAAMSALILEAMRIENIAIR